MADQFRIWLTMRLLAIAWRVLPRSHPAYRGIFDAASCIRDHDRKQRHKELLRELTKCTNHGQGLPEKTSAESLWRRHPQLPVTWDQLSPATRMGVEFGLTIERRAATTTASSPVGEGGKG